MMAGVYKINGQSTTIASSDRVRIARARLTLSLADTKLISTYTLTQQNNLIETAIHLINYFLRQTVSRGQRDSITDQTELK